MGNVQKKPSNQNSNSYHPDIIIVNDKFHTNIEQDDKKELNKLQYVPLFYPILRSSIDLKDDQQLYELNSEPIFQLSELLKNHLNVCAFNVTKDQEAIKFEVKHLNFVIDILMQNFTEKQKKYAKYCEQFKTVQEMSHSLKKIQKSMNEILPMLDEINNFLPENERLEEFSFKK